MLDFVKLSDKYRVRIDQFNPKISWISKDTFDTYEEAWQYAKQESGKFGDCGFCVIYDELPELSIHCEFPQCPTCALENCNDRQRT